MKECFEKESGKDVEKTNKKKGKKGSLKRIR